MDIGEETSNPLDYDKTKPREENEWRSIYGDKLDPSEALALKVQDDNLVSPPCEILKAIDWSSRIEKILKVSPQKLAQNHPRERPRGEAKPTRQSSMTLAFEGSLIARPKAHYLYSVEHPRKDEFFGATIDGCTPNVTYDMDEQDCFWLNRVNTERRGRGLKKISEDDFEFIIDRLERGWFFLSRAGQRWTSRRIESRSAEELRCDICWDGETTLHNLIVICEGCDIPVHQECYGVPLIPEGPWLCRKCYLGIDDAKCSLCPWQTGAFKQTTNTLLPWCHLLCAIMLGGEAQILNSTYQEPIDINQIHPERWSLTCQACRQKKGAPIQCSIKSCHTALHPKCARAIGCFLDYQAGLLKCWRHSGVESNNNNGIIPSSGRDKGSPFPPTIQIDAIESMNKPQKNSRAKPFQNPIAPQVLIDALLRQKVCTGMPEKQRLGAVEVVARYWSLKRTFRHGTALIRSLQVEPWTSGGLLNNVQSALQEKLGLLNELRCLERLCLLTVQMERQKLGSMLVNLEMINIITNPVKVILTIMIVALRSADPNGFFADPVDILLVPDYYEIVEHPMDLSTITEKVATDSYSTMAEFSSDVERIYSNAILYNREGTVYHEAAGNFILKARAIIESGKVTLEKLKINSCKDQWLSPLKWLLPLEEAEAITPPPPPPTHEGQQRGFPPPITTLSQKRKVGRPPGKRRGGLNKLVVTPESLLPERSLRGRRRREVLKFGNDEMKLVWAKMRGYPIYPARIVNVERMKRLELKKVPSTVMEKAKCHKDHVIVQFFDKIHAWAALPRLKLLPLGKEFSDDLQKLIRLKKLVESTSEKVKKDLQRAHKEALTFAKEEG